jgi:hypothetical protein
MGIAKNELRGFKGEAVFAAVDLVFSLIPLKPEHTLIMLQSVSRF